MPRDAGFLSLLGTHHEAHGTGYMLTVEMFMEANNAYLDSESGVIYSCPRVVCYQVDTWAVIFPLTITSQTT